MEGKNKKPLYSSLGVVCLQEKKNPSDPELEALIKHKRVVVLSNFDNDKETATLNTSQIMTFVNFLVSIRRKEKLADGMIFTNLPKLFKKDYEPQGVYTGSE